MTLKKNDYWYTPPEVWNAINSFLGSDVFDPCPVNPDFDGLEVFWKKDCYINPPYSKETKRKFIKKAKIAFGPGCRFVWTLNYANSQDLKEIHSLASAICIPFKRIKFIPGHPELGDGKSPRYDSVIVLWGHDTDGFCKAFSSIGKVYTTKGS